MQLIKMKVELLVEVPDGYEYEKNLDYAVNNMCHKLEFCNALRPSNVETEYERIP